MKLRLKEINILKVLYRMWKSFKYECRFNVFTFIIQFFKLLKARVSLKRLAVNKNFRNDIKFLYPCLTDSISYTPIDPIYFYQGVWGAKKIYEIRPEHHFDIGSQVQFVGIISQFCPVTMIDIRPLTLKLDNLNFKKGSILELPFENDSIKNLSSLCVIEHIGLGRYGDEIDPFGSEKAIKEIERVLESGGNFIFSLPVDRENRVYFNAHRAFTREYVIELFKGFDIIDEAYIYGEGLCKSYDGNAGFGTGMWHVKKK